jgi:uncharacterized lipoprotein YmbA
MMRRRTLLLWGAVLLPAACRSPDPKLYTISSAPGPVVSGGPRAITLRQVSLARYLERQEIVRSSEDYRLAVEANDWWGEPLGAMIGRVLVESLGQRLAGTQVRLSVRPAGPSLADQVAATSQAVGQLADAIARLVAQTRQ